MGVPYFASLKVATLGRRGRAVTISNKEEDGQKQKCLISVICVCWD